MTHLYTKCGPIIEMNTHLYGICREKFSNNILTTKKGIISKREMDFAEVIPIVFQKSVVI